MSELEFRVLACKDAHVRLMYDRTNTTHKFIEVAFGHHGNKFIGIRDRKHGVVVGDLAFYAGSYLDCFNWKFFRVCKYGFFCCWYIAFHFKKRLDGLYKVYTSTLLFLWIAWWQSSFSNLHVWFTQHFRDRRVSVVAMITDPILWKLLDQILLQCLVGWCKPLF